MIIIIQCEVRFDSDLEELEGIAIEAGQEVLRLIGTDKFKFKSSVLLDPPIFCNSSTYFSLKLHVQESVSLTQIKHDFIKAVHKRLRREGVETPFPIIGVHIKKDKIVDNNQKV